jgi:cytochrome P450
VFNPFEPGFAADPYPHYRAQREVEPVQHLPIGPWIVLEHAECTRLLRDTSLSVDARKARAVDPEQETVRQRIIAEVAPDAEVREDHSILNIDPPDHTRLRRLVSSVFTPKRVSELRPLVRRLVDQHLDAAAPNGEMDLVRDLAFPLPFTVISEMMGMPEADRDQVRDWSHTLVRILDFTIGPDEMRASLEAGENMRSHLTEVIAWKREHPADDLLSALIRAEEDGDVLSDTELLDQVMLLYIAGHETTVNLIGNGTWALLQHRDQLELWRDDPDLGPAAIDELLRFDSPVQLSRRIALVDIEVGGLAVPAGSFVLTSLGSANHDPAVFGPTADELDLRRPDAARHLAFGSGTHHCLGASLARLQGAEAIGALLRRFPDLEPAGDPAWNGRLVLRGMDSLPLTLGVRT